MKSSVTLVRAGKAETLVYRTDFITWADPGREDTSIEAEVVFVGDGVTAPEQSYDDYKGVDARGKIVAMLPEATNCETTLKVQYSSSEAKIATPVAHAEVAIMIIANTM